MAAGKAPSLADLLTAERQRKPGPKCAVGTLLAKLDDADRAALEQALALPTTEMQHAQIHRALRSPSRPVPVVIGQDTIGRHRAGECGCGR